MAGTIITFYSYKGGVGRSFALVNTATILASWGFDVLCVDWDLEAPGLDAYFEPYLAGPPGRGLAEAFTAFAAGEPVDPGEFVTPVALPRVRGRVDLLPAGHPDDLVRLVQRLDWAAMYRDGDLGAALEQWRARWTSDYHFVLIDSRTGITDIGGVCTAQMPDVLVTMFTASEQSVRGVRDVIRRAEKARDNLPYDRARLLVLPVPSRFEGREEYREAERWRGRFADAFTPVIEQWVHQRTPVGLVLANVTIPYVAYWSFGERIAALEETSPTPNDISYSMQTLAALLAHRLDRTQMLGESRESYIAAASRQGLRNSGGVEGAAGPVDVYLNQAAGSAQARVFRDALVRRGLKVHVSGDELDAEALARSIHMILLIEKQATARQVQDAELFLRQTLDEGSERSLQPVLLPGATPRGLPQAVLQIAGSQVPAGGDVDIEAQAGRIALDQDYRIALRRHAQILGDRDLSESERATAVSRSYLTLARLAEERGALSEAEEAFGDALRTIGSSDDRRTLAEIGEAEAGLGRTVSRRGELNAAARWQERAVATFERLLSRHGPGHGARRLLADAYYALGQTQMDGGRISDAEYSFDLAANWLADEPDAVELLGRVLDSRAGIRVLRGKSEGAEADLLRVVELTTARLAAVQPPEQSLILAAATANTRLGEFYVASDEPRQAAPCLEEAVFLYERAARAAQRSGADLHPHQLRLAEALTRLADVLVSLDFTSARATYTRAIALFQEIGDTDGLWPIRVALTLAKRGGLELRVGHDSAAIVDYQQAVQVLRNASIGDRVAREFLAHTLGLLGQAAAAADDVDLARESLTESLEIVQGLVASDRLNPQASRALGDAHRRIGVFEEVQGNPREARTAFRAALSNYRQIEAAAEAEVTRVELARVEEMLNEDRA